MAELEPGDIGGDAEREWVWTTRSDVDVFTLDGSVSVEVYGVSWTAVSLCTLVWVIPGP